MTSRRRLRKECRSKVAYPTLAEAVAARRRLEAQGKPGHFHAYPCRLCGKFHVGRPSARVRQAIAARRMAG